MKGKRPRQYTPHTAALSQTPPPFARLLPHFDPHLFPACFPLAAAPPHCLRWCPACPASSRPSRWRSVWRGGWWRASSCASSRRVGGLCAGYGACVGWVGAPTGAVAGPALATLLCADMVTRLKSNRCSPPAPCPAPLPLTALLLLPAPPPLPLPPLQASSSRAGRGCWCSRRCGAHCL